MISAVRTSKRRSGFTLLEIVVVLVIAALVMGGAFGMMKHSSDERVLRRASVDIELMAKRARTTAILQQTPYALEFRFGVLRLLPLAEAGQDEKRTAGGHRIGGEVVTVSGEHQSYAWDEETDVYVRRWNSEEWLRTGPNSIHVWRFDPGGLCEPLSVKLVRHNSWLEDVFHPLTASIKESQFETR